MQPYEQYHLGGCTFSTAGVQPLKYGAKKLDREIMKTKIITYLIQCWFALQAAFSLYWPLVLYYNRSIKFYEMLALGCIIFPASILIAVKNDIIRKIATCLLWIYSIAFAFIGTLANLVASPKPMFALALTVVMFINIALLLVNHFLVVKRRPTLNDDDKRL